MEPAVFPFAARLIGFSPAETTLLQTHFAFAREAGQGHAYFCLSADSLQDPDLYIVNGDEVKALAVLADLNTSDIRPALLIGAPAIALPYPTVPRPMQKTELFEQLSQLVARRADALAKLAAVNIIAVPERRRRERVDMDLTDPVDYEKMRRAPARGGVLIVDKAVTFRDHVAAMLARYHIAVSWVAGADAAVNLCNQSPMSVVLINTSLQDVDPYRLCAAIKNNNAVTKTAVIFLNGADFTHDSARAHKAGFDGLLDKPLSATHLLAALRKFMTIK